VRVDLFDFELPEELIALRPASPRDAARLLVVAGEPPFEQARVRDLPRLLAPGDLLVLNDTKVVAARLAGLRPARGPDTPPVAVEATLIERAAEDEWVALARPGRRLRPGDRLIFGAGDTLHAEIMDKRPDGSVRVRFDRGGEALDAAMAAVGAMPLPPYIASRRAPDARDAADYQTIYAERPGAVAAPTAGLHFTPDLFERLRQAGIGVVRVTLHVGAGTFKPVTAEDTDDHRMHAEEGVLDEDAAAAINAARAAGRRVVAVGTTSLRLLESAAGLDGIVRPFRGATDIFITPGYRFRAVDALLTNFHLPRSTLVMLVAAFAGLDRIHAAYAQAIRDRFRFYSYGDATLLFPEGQPS